MKSNSHNPVGTLQTNVNNNATAMSNIQMTVLTLQTGLDSVSSQTGSDAIASLQTDITTLNNLTFP